jgi:hypothetical protein
VGDRDSHDSANSLHFERVERHIVESRWHAATITLSKVR